MSDASYLIHYASPYYDPVKAHEYYMKNRELKGPRRTGTLNEEGQKAKDYVRKQINDERDTKLASEDSSRVSQLESQKNQHASMMEKTAAERDADIANHTSQITSKVARLQKQLKYMSGPDKKAKSASIRAEIDGLREQNAAKRAEIQEAYASKSAQLKTDYASKTNSIRETSRTNKQNIRQEAKNKYNEELDKIYSESRFIKPKKSKR